MDKGNKVQKVTVTLYFVERYYFIATKTSVSNAIFKDILIQRGLVSLLDYYEGKFNVRFN